MGTHPIFESDFDCLTEFVIMKLFVGFILVCFCMADPLREIIAPEVVDVNNPADGSIKLHKDSLQEVVEDMSSKSMIQDKQDIELELENENDIDHVGGTIKDVNSVIGKGYIPLIIEKACFEVINFIFNQFVDFIRSIPNLSMETLTGISDPWATPFYLLITTLALKAIYLRLFLFTGRKYSPYFTMRLGFRKIENYM